MVALMVLKSDKEQTIVTLDSCFGFKSTNDVWFLINDLICMKNSRAKLWIEIRRRKREYRAACKNLILLFAF